MQIKSLILFTAILLFCRVEASSSEIIMILDSKLSDQEMVLAASLQGVAAKHGHKVYIAVGEYGFWLDEFECQGYKLKRLTLSALSEEYAKLADGYVLCDMGNVSVAATLAGSLNSIVVTPDIAKTYGIEKRLDLVFDARGKGERWLLEYVENNEERFSFDGIMQHNPQRPFSQIDYVIARNKICIYGKNDPELVRRFYSLIKPNTARMGWGAPYGEERNDVSLGAKYGLYTLPSSNTINMSVLSLLEAERETPRRKPKMVKERKKVPYVMLMMSDGDNLNWTLTGMVSSGHYMTHPGAEGQFINWMYPPIMERFSPLIHNYYMRKLPQNNYLIGAVSGIGYTYPSLHKPLDSYCEITDLAMKNSEMDYCVIMDVGDFRTNQKQVMREVAQKMKNVNGFYYMDYGNYAKWGGDSYIVSGKPVVSFRYRLWLPQNPIEKIASQINSASRDTSSIDAYSAVVVHAWSYKSEDIIRFISLLDSDVVLVNGQQFMELITQNVKLSRYE